MEPTSEHSLANLRSKSLPVDFFAPAYTSVGHGLSDIVEKRFRYLRTATTSLLRVISIGGGLSWLVVLLLQPIDDPLLGFSIVSIAWWGLVIVAAVVTISGLFKMDEWYRWAMGLGGIYYCVLLVVHAISLGLLGESVLASLKLGDYSAIPAAFLVAAWPRASAAALALGAVALSAAINLGTEIGFKLLIEILHALAPVVPFVIVVVNGLKTTKIIDSAALQTYRDATLIASQKALKEQEARFLAFVHDRVLTQLSAMWRGTAPATNTELQDQLDQARGLAAPSSGRCSYSEAIDSVIAAVRSEYPNVQVEELEQSPEYPHSLPVTAAIALAQAMRQAASNVAKHASGANAVLSFVTKPGDIEVMLLDDGPGFRLSELSEDRAGIRVSIIGRALQTSGCRAEVHPIVGQGTKVTVGWNRDADSEKAAQQLREIPSVYESMGFSAIYQVIPAIIAWLVFLGLSLLSDHSQPVLWLTALICAAIALRFIIDRPQKLLRIRFAWGACIFIWLFYAAALGENSPDIDVWPFAWAPWAALLMCGYLAMRNRPLFGWTAWIGCMIIGQVFSILGSSSSYISPANSWIHSLVLIPASILPWMVKRISDGMSLLLDKNRKQAANLAVHTTRTRFLEERKRWLHQRIAVLLDPNLDEDVRRFGAHMFEYRLRDAIRSPLLDLPGLSADTWDARLRGATVKLLDDHGSKVPSAANLVEVEKCARQKLRSARVGDLIVVRLLPPGRDCFATILHRNEESGAVQLEKIQFM